MKLPTPPPARADMYSAVFQRLEPGGAALAAFTREMEKGPAPGGKYRHWDSLRHVPSPKGLRAEDVWAARKMARMGLYRMVPLLDKRGEPFRYALVDPVLERLHRIDRDAAGRIALPERTATEGERDRYLMRSLREEAIASSQLEGASTTRRVAKEMLRTGRAPRTRSEQMILNNYRAMESVRERVDEPLTPDVVTDLHRVVTEGTLDGSGPFRQAGDGIAVYDDQDQLLHAPPPPDQIAERLERMCAFANEAETGVFLHPALKSILLHFWLAYDHPFVDGNGRTARALFYWSMLREGFWLAEFLSISTVIKRAPARYAKSFLYTETDDNDLTYFILAQLRVIELAVQELGEHLEQKSREVQEARALLRPTVDLNHRQLALLSHAIRRPDAAYTIASHRRSHDVAYATARADLLDLAARGLLDKRKQGRAFVFTVPADLADRLKSLDA
ncbi:Fic family protein [Rubrivirga sp. S365]|uniref:Fic family protein n=1 Tax=Rubrivirga litoralis TaxID=3075598 RepID=A0ABU3BPR6_9BACT|nr:MULTISPECIES: Fic family protein [unclassified Rubrivirga]MDT0631268.1 Fic family protein [Rubrivirga sp. F394]MDT7856028.1 Fic family protein [Rubrivirga sp. S365]